MNTLSVMVKNMVNTFSAENKEGNVGSKLVFVHYGNAVYENEIIIHHSVN